MDPPLYAYCQVDSIVFRRHEMSKKLRLSNIEKEGLESSLSPNSAESHKEQKSPEEMNAMQVDFQKTINEKNEEIANLQKEKEEKTLQTRNEMKAMQDGFQKSLDAKNEEIAYLKEEMERFEAKCHKAVTEAEQLRGKMAVFEELSTSSTSLLTLSELECLEQFSKHLKAVSDMPQSTKVKAKGMQKLIASIYNYRTNSEDLVAKCMYLKNTKATNQAFRNLLSYFIVYFHNRQSKGRLQQAYSISQTNFGRTLLAIGTQSKYD